MIKKLNPQAIVALKEALTEIYWYKRDLRTFLTSALSHRPILARLDWDDYKRNIVGALVDLLVHDPAVYQDDLVNLMILVANFRDFSHLSHLEDGKAKAQRAESSVKKLRAMVDMHEEILHDKAEVEEETRTVPQVSFSP